MSSEDDAIRLEAMAEVADADPTDPMWQKLGIFFRAEAHAARREAADREGRKGGRS